MATLTNSTESFKGKSSLCSFHYLFDWDDKNHFFHDYLTIFHSYPKSGDKIKHFLETCLRVLNQISENRRWFEFEKRGFLSGLLHHSARLHHSIFGKLSSLHPPMGDPHSHFHHISVCNDIILRNFWYNYLKIIFII